MAVQKAVRKRPINLPLKYYDVILVGSPAVLVGAFTYLTLDALGFFPSLWVWVIVAAIISLYLYRPALGITASLTSLVLPIAWVSLPLAVLFLLLWLIVKRFRILTPTGFLLLALLAVVYQFPALGPLLLVVPLAAGFQGSRRGPFLAGIACLVSTMLGILGGQESLGPLRIGVTQSLVKLPPTPPEAPLSPDWLVTAVHNLTARATIDLIVSLLSPLWKSPLLAAQILLWALAAYMVARIMAGSRFDWTARRALAIGAGAATLVVGQILLLDQLAGVELAGAAVVGLALAASAGGVTVFFFASHLENMDARAQRPVKIEIESTTPVATEKVPPPSLGRPGASWDDLAGIQDIKAEVMEAIRSQFDSRFRAALSRMHIAPARGILLYGPPGTGKTHLGQVIASQAGATFIRVSGTEFTSKWFGESEANLRRIFRGAQESRPVVLFFDELEAILPRRDQMSRADAPELGIVDTFLAQTDGVADIDGLLLLGATNRPDLIDPAALRPGRFDKIIYVGPPGQEARRQIFSRYLKNRPLAEDVDLDRLAAQTERFTGADIRAVCDEAARKVLGQGAVSSTTAITMADLLRVIEGTKPSVSFDMLRLYERIADAYSRRSEKVVREEVIEKSRLTWDDVSGLDQVKQVLRESIEWPLAHPAVLTRYGIKVPKGVLLFGPPGCGKTYLAKVVASQANAHFLHVKGPELLTGTVGASEAKLRGLFDRARENAPCVLFFDEIDGLAGLRYGGQRRTELLTQLLTEMDGVEELRGVVVVAATNRPEDLDPAILRPGRFDRLIYVPPPDQVARTRLFEMELANKPLDPDVDWGRLAEITHGYSGADIVAICTAAAMDAVRETLSEGCEIPVTMKHLTERVRQTPPSISQERLAQYEQMRIALAR
ncbi:AAA family ATPase [Candidatus Hakubella thermalkaliphila]|uniref:AAA family ATPase n=1 Tax=Candidatus Hakubella thermalkaliphila TaxID=2754717 RepID=UPI001C614646|nr:AAA family ATPase [Candidatus Hakubella thermalkaliphila]